MMKTINYYNILGIYTRGGIPPIPYKEITDTEILGQYTKLKNRIMVKIQEKLSSNQGDNEHKQIDTKNLEKSLNELEEAFKILETAEKRKKYEEECIRNAGLQIGMERLIDKEEEESSEYTNILEGIQIDKFNTSNRALDVREDSTHIPYTPIYSDEKVQILELAKLNFLNGGVLKDQLYQYIMLLKKDGSYTSVYDFYTNNIQGKIQDSRYREVLYKAILDEILSQKKYKYIGSIDKNQKGNYYICIDGGQQDAAKGHQMQLANHEKNQQKNEKYK